MKIEQHILISARAHASEAAPQESCGLIVIIDGIQQYRRCRNISLNGADTFIIHPEDYAAAEDEGEIACVVHSHPFASPEPSQLDRMACAQGSIPWLIVNHPVGHHTLTLPESYQPPLVGREFVHGVFDCYALVKDYYQQECGIALPHYERNDEWWRAGKNLYMDHFGEAGFVRVDGAPEKHDVFLMQIRSPVPNHAAVYLGDEMILHHLYNRLSTRDTYGGYWQYVTTLQLRHRSFTHAA